MDWIQALTIIISMVAITVAITFYLNNKLDNLNLNLSSKIDNINYNLNNKIDNLSKEIQNVKTELTKEINLVKMEVLWIKFRLDPNEHPKWTEIETKEIE